MTPFSALDGGGRQATATVASSGFIAKDLTSVDIDVVGGNGILGYTVAYNSALLSGYNDPVTANILRASEAGTVNTVSLSAAALTSIGDTIYTDASHVLHTDAAKSLVFKIWDSTEETTRGTNSQYATLTVPMQIDITDDVSPTATIAPFYWTSASDNSLYGNSKANGHIEITGVVDNADPDVSGQISIRGTAYDDTRLSSLWLSIADTLNVDRFSFAGSGPTKTLNGRTYYEVAAYNPATGTWVGTDQWATNGWKFTVTPVSLSQGGHTVSWQLDWDTAKVKGSSGLLVAALNNCVRIEAEDKRTTTNAAVTAGGFTIGNYYRIETVGSTDFTAVGALANGVGVIFRATGVGTNDGTARLANPNASDESTTTQTATGALTPYYSMDVVPYITGIARSANTTRSRLGKYPVRDSEANIVVSGFNVTMPTTQDTNNWVRIYSAASGGNYDTDLITVQSSPAPTSTAFDITLNTDSNSGYLRLAVNGIESINNIDNDSLECNKEISSASASTTAAWTDDRYLEVFRTGDYFSGSNDPEYISMSVSSTSLVGEWSNSAAAATYYGTPAADGNTRSTIFTTYDPATYTDVFVDSANVVHSVILENYYGGSGTTDWGYLASYIGTGSRVSIESLGDDRSTNVDYTDGMDEKLSQFQNPRIAARGTANDQYVCYYDFFSKCLKYGRMTNGANTFVSDNGHQKDSKTVVDGTDDFSATLSDTTDVGMWSDIQIDNIGTGDTTAWRPVIVYYDNANEKLKIARGNSSQPSGTSGWTKQDVDVASTASVNEGQYLGNKSLSMKIDSNGDLHIITCNSMEGGLYYIHAANINGTGTYTFDPPVLVDPTVTDGSWADLTLNGTLPMVSYRNGTSYKGLKYAYVASGTGTSISDWEYMVVPTATTVNDGRTCIEYTSSATVFPYDGNVAFGYPSSTFQIVYLRRQVP